jgi:nicotinate-nucleotide pyrophosphorylase (carboxylating)
MYDYLKPEYIHAFIKQALAEDIGEGDHSTLASVPAGKIAKARLLVKDNGILAGVEMAQHIFRTVDSELQLQILLQDGQAIQKGDIVLYAEGKAQSILQAERLVLNCMQRMSGIATHTRHLANKIKHTKAQLLDTRKTTPNFRIAEKWAVKIGGGTNHRFGLFDMVMLKDNHIDYAGGIKQAIEQTKAYLQRAGKTLRIEVETRSLEELEEVLAVGGVDVIMLDNYSLDNMRTAVARVAGKVALEASGGITEATIVPIAETGVDFISVGALTHSAGSLDLSLKAFA